MGLGVEPWRYGHDVEARILRAVRWRARYRPYFHSAALRSWRTGFPHTLTPLAIALPDDASTHTLHERSMWQWLVDANLLAHPLLDRANATWRKDVYLPPGEWIDVNTGERHTGPSTIAGYDHRDIAVPAFVGGGGILVAEEPGSGGLIAEVWPMERSGRRTEYEFIQPAPSAPGEELTSTIVVVAGGADSDVEDGTATTVIDMDNRRSGGAPIRRLRRPAVSPRARSRLPGGRAAVGAAAVTGFDWQFRRQNDE